jgi:Mrp family chromosome partitioning ATPase
VRRRWRLFTGIILLACIGVGIFLAFRDEPNRPVRYRTIAEIQIAEKVPEVQVERKPGLTTTTRLSINRFNGPEDLAMRNYVRTGALRRVGLPADVRGIGMQSTINEDEDTVFLTVSSRRPATSQRLALAWAQEFARARRDVGKRGVEREKERIRKDLAALRRRLLVVDFVLLQKVARLPDLVPNGSGGCGNTRTPTPLPLNERAPLSQQLLAFERCALISRIAEDATRYAELSTKGTIPNAFARIIGQTDPLRTFPPEPSKVAPAGFGLLAGIVTALGATLVVDRIDRSIRSNDAAAAAFGAPVLGTMPPLDDDVWLAVLEEPGSPAGEAYRALGAMALSTDRLPRTLMVTTPHGDACDEVATNLAAALARYHARVVVLATAPHQDPYFASFAPPEEGPGTLPALLDLASSGQLEGGVLRRLWSHTWVSSLFAIRPPADQTGGLAINGLAPLLGALEAEGVDVCVIAGPPLLEHAESTIVAWTAGSILWTLRQGEIKLTDARASVSRVQLADGVEPFGVVVVEERSPWAARVAPPEPTIDLRGTEPVVVAPPEPDGEAELAVAPDTGEAEPEAEATGEIDLTDDPQVGTPASEEDGTEPESGPDG